jgi:hypothetical protein
MTKDDMGYEKRVTVGTMGERRGYSLLLSAADDDDDTVLLLLLLMSLFDDISA